MSKNEAGLNPGTVKKSYVSLTLGVLCIGSSPLFIRWANVSGSISAFYRMLFSFLLLAVFALVSPRLRRGFISEITTVNRSLVAWASLGGVFYAFENALYNQAIIETTATNAVLLTNLSTIWVALGAYVLLQERLSFRFWLGVVITLAGVALVVNINLHDLTLNNPGDLLAIAASLFYAAYMLTTQQTRKAVSTYLYLFLTMLSASIVLFGLSVFQGLNLIGHPAQSYLNLFLVALIGQTIGFLSINFAQGYIPATRVAIFLLAQPIVTLVLSYFLLSEQPTLLQLLGVGIVLTGIYVVNQRS